MVAMQLNQLLKYGYMSPAYWWVCFLRCVPFSRLLRLNINLIFGVRIKY